MTSKKRWIPWLVAALVVCLVGAGVLRAVLARQAQQRSLAVASAPAAAVAMEIAPGEIWTVRRQNLVLGVPVSGTLRAVQSATIKARVAGELQGLTLREGDSVRAGQEVARIEAVEMQARLRQAQQQADAARAQVDIGQRQFDNNRALVDQGFISRTALDTSQASLQAAQSSYQAALAAAEVARKSLTDTVLRSPISGQVAQRLAQNGERVAVEARILEVVDLSAMEVEALLAPADALAVRVGQAARLQIEGHGGPVSATVARINPSAQAGSRTVPVYLAVEGVQVDAVLRQGLFVQGTLDTGAADLLAVPLDAVRTDKPAPYVQVADNGRVAHRNVRTGARSQADGQALVAVEGLPEGAQVLAGRVGPLPEGTALRLPPASSAPPANP
ncbi:efflux transporter periplasmic adaptor subunit [Acidovorax sp. SRB_14]|uniref:efflux RND transporter periplasmic adaptor subunit n=1 Tax=unclassified Acidovorax TaxID=2684926 RepID=UPI00145C9399|nr:MULTISPECIES: efflux RND transporter periplasmic adaptor subunit [unclassified Acidovorax]NMM77977.1 efflux transporter periplasmic adaptor subunit [Acidovorax sp. SRB_24]NMM78004.1 efflux transporter periplasmic adaptor subunit [Acidovorax sp. SRB_24]NMM79430.1 efflux transporter periplasmic adaptor subunit [Acidovorax sp. SRB_14]